LGRDRAVVDERLQGLAQARAHLRAHVRRGGRVGLVDLLDHGRRSCARCGAGEPGHADDEPGGSPGEEPTGEPGGDCAPAGRGGVEVLLVGHDSASLRRDRRGVGDNCMVNQAGEGADGAT
jgi:hypothetical protein